MSLYVKEVVNYIRENENKIAVSATIDLRNLSGKQKTLLYKIAGSCILNGPLGVGKRNFWKDDEGEIVETSIRDLVGCSGFAWKSFCREIALEFDKKECQCTRVWGNVWPLCEKDGQLPEPLRQGN